MADGNKNEHKTTFKDIKGEFKKITWPTKKELRTQTVTVIFACILIAVIIFVMDYTLNFGVSRLGNYLLNRPVAGDELDYDMSDFEFNLEDLLMDEEEVAYDEDDHFADGHTHDDEDDHFADGHTHDEDEDADDVLED